MLTFFASIGVGLVVVGFIFWQLYLLRTRKSEPKRPILSEPTDLAPVYWGVLYQFLGLEDQWKAHSKKLRFSESANLWPVPVLEGITIDQVLRLLEGWEVKIPWNKEKMKDISWENIRDPKNGSYIVHFSASRESRKAQASDLAALFLHFPDEGITLLEYFLLLAAYYLATTSNDFLDRFGETICSGTVRVSGENREVPVIGCQNASDPGLNFSSQVDIVNSPPRELGIRQLESP